MSQLTRHFGAFGDISKRPEDGKRSGRFIHLGICRRCLPRVALWRITVALVIAAAIAGCGTSRVMEPNGGPTSAGTSIQYAPNGVVVLARQPISGGYLSIRGVRYSYMGKTYFGLRENVETSSKHRIVSGGGSGTSIKPGEYGILTMRVDHGCVGTYGYALAYGLLRNPSDMVTASSRDGKLIRFKQVAVPLNLHAHGVLVYALLGSGQINILTRTANGQIVGNESYAGRAFVACPGR